MCYCNFQDSGCINNQCHLSDSIFSSCRIGYNSNAGEVFASCLSFGPPQQCQGELKVSPTSAEPFLMCCQTDSCNSEEALGQLIEAAGHSVPWITTSSTVSTSSSSSVLASQPTGTTSQSILISSTRPSTVSATKLSPSRTESYSAAASLCTTCSKTNTASFATSTTNTNFSTTGEYTSFSLLHSIALIVNH